MDHFNYQHGELCAEQVRLRRIAAEIGTPCYVYSRATLERHWKVFDQAFGSHPHLICYSVKANGNLALLNLLARLGSGFDIVSGGELARVLKAGGDAKKIVFSGVGKSAIEIETAFRAGIRCFNVESEPELLRINEVVSRVQTSDQSRQAPISIRVNPNVDAKTHPYISTGLKDNKFGVEMEQALALYRLAERLPHIHIAGIDCHIGSQLTELAPFLDALDLVLGLIDQLKRAGIIIKHLDMGGGLGIRYSQETPPDPASYIQALLDRLGERPLEIVLEPGRAIVGNAGVLLTRVEYIKPTSSKNFAIVDAAMNDLIRPVLYGAWQEIITVSEHPPATEIVYDVVGPVCETGDFLGKTRSLRINAGDLLAIRSSGAYAAAMSSNYNARPRGAEVLVDQDRFHVVRERESVEDLYRHEHLVPI